MQILLRTALKHDATAKLRLGRLWWALLMAIPAAAALMPIRSSFWLDETMTYWTTYGGLGDIVRRCTLSPHSILYSTLMWAVDRIAGHSEIVFRIPSVLAGFATAYLLYRLARGEFGHEAALSAVVLFASAPAVAYAVVDARPYALGLLCVVAASLLLLRWVHTGRLAYALGSGAAAALVPHFHFLFTPVLGAHALYVALMMRRRRIRIREAAAAVLCFGVIVAPLEPQFAEAMRTSVTHSFSPAPNVLDLFLALVPFPTLLWALVAGVMLTQRPLRLKRPRVQPELATFVLAMAVLPPLVLWSVSVMGESHVFLPRFLLSSAPGSALLSAVLFQMIDSVRLRRQLLTAAVFFLLIAWVHWGFMFDHGAGRGDWKSALAFAEHNTSGDSAPVLIRSQYIESDYMDWRHARLDDSILYTPLVYYPARAAFVPLPVGMSPDVETYLRDFARKAAARGQRFLFMAYPDVKPHEPFIRVLADSLAGWRVRRVGNFGGIQTYEFSPG